jgi:acyl-homoserine-lactone acylase
MEMHLVGPNYDLYGAPQIGFPVAVVGFNRHAGWGRTVNTIDTVDLFQLTVKDGQYLYDGQLRAFERSSKKIKIKQPDGSMREETIDIRRTVQGPVVYDENGLTLAMRVAGIDGPRMLEQWFREAKPPISKLSKKRCVSWPYRCGMPTMPTIKGT